MVVVDGHGVPLGNLLDAASPAAVTLVEPTLETIAVARQGRGRPRQRPERLIYDKAWDADALRQRLARRGIDLICPHRQNRTSPPLPDGCKWRRDKRRWKVERTVCLVGQFSSPGGALGASYDDVQSVLSRGVPTDYTQELMKLLLVSPRANLYSHLWSILSAQKAQYLNSTRTIGLAAKGEKPQRAKQKGTDRKN
jgi:hypothetical protein